MNAPRRAAKVISLPKPSTLANDDEVGDLRRDPKSRVSISAGGRDRGPKAAKAQRSTERTDIHYEDQKTLSVVTRVVDTLGSLYKNGSITESQYKAGIRFQDGFDMGNWEPMPAMRFDGMPSSGRSSSDPHRPQSIVDARKLTIDAMKALGGQGSPCGICAWWILGMRWSIRQVAQREVVNRVEVWTGTLIGALGVLESHYAG